MKAATPLWAIRLRGFRVVRRRAALAEAALTLLIRRLDEALRRQFGRLRLLFGRSADRGRPGRRGSRWCRQVVQKRLPDDAARVVLARVELLPVDLVELGTHLFAHPVFGTVSHGA